MAEALTKQRRKRGGHRSAIKKLSQQVTDAVNDLGGDPTKNNQLKLSVEEKLATLKNLDAEILDLLTEDTSVSEEAIAEEVEQADTVKELAYGAIVFIDDVLKSAPQLLPRHHHPPHTQWM